MLLLISLFGWFAFKNGHVIQNPSGCNNKAAARCPGLPLIQGKVCQKVVINVCSGITNIPGLQIVAGYLRGLSVPI